MTNEELVAKIQAGERDLLPVLWEQVRRFVAKIARRWANAAINKGICIEVDDYIQSGYLALDEAVDKYNTAEATEIIQEQDGDDEVTECKSSFINFLSFYLKKYFLQLSADASGWSRGAYQSKKVPFVTSLNAPLAPGDDESGELEDFIPDPSDGYADTEEQIYHQQLHDKLEEALDTLEPDARRTVELRYYEDKTLEQVADVMGISRERVRQREAQALTRLRRPEISRELENFIDLRTNYYLHIGVASFNTTGMSSVDRIVELRDEMMRHAERNASIKSKAVRREELVARAFLIDDEELRAKAMDEIRAMDMGIQKAETGGVRWKKEGA